MPLLRAENLILSGPKGSGRHTVAVELVKRLLRVGKDGNYEKHPDFAEIRSEDGKMIRKDEIDSLCEKAAFMPLSAPRKVFLIDDGELLKNDAQNGLLKMLEDQSDNCVVLIVSEHPLISTIESRCQKIRFGKVSEKRAEEYVRSVLSEDFDLARWQFSGETIGNYIFCSTQQDSVELTKKLWECILHGSADDILDCAGCLKEKDTELLTEVLTAAEMGSCLGYLKARLTEMLLQAVREDWRGCFDTGSILALLAELDTAHKNVSIPGRFGKHELFRLLQCFIERRDG